MDTSTNKPSKKILRTSEDPESYDYYQKTVVQKRGFKTYTEYLDWLASSKGYHASKDYNLARLRKRGLLSSSEQKTLLAAKLGMASSSEYDAHLAKLRRNRPRYVKLSRMLRSKLEELGQSQRWLSQKTGISNQLISRYFNALSYPKPEKLKRIKTVLGIQSIK